MNSLHGVIKRYFEKFRVFSDKILITYIGKSHLGAP